MIFKRFWFSFVALVCVTFLFALLALEFIPAWVYFIVTGKYASFLDDITEKTFDYIQNRINNQSSETD